MVGRTLERTEMLRKEYERKRQQADGVLPDFGGNGK
jgi:hypothetical protein